jgi:hypothetical protein
MSQDGWYTYPSSNALIDVYRTKQYILTSVESPRHDGKGRIWQPEQSEINMDHFRYVKSLNERFHGTTQFEPGVPGYQQHLWCAALDTELEVFVNHPGQSCEAMTEVRPGYWYGNGVIPALKQIKNVLGAVYIIPEEYPIHFTHLYWNEKRFDCTLQNQKWLFGQKADGYIGIWCNLNLNDYDDALFGCEKRAYGLKSAWLIICGSHQEYGDFESFCVHCENRQVEFSPENNTLKSVDLELSYIPGKNDTQIVE